MFRLILLMFLFMVMVFSIISHVLGDKSSSGGPNPISQFTKSVSGSMKKADNWGPDLSNSLGSVKLRLPGSPNNGFDSDATPMAFKDHSNVDFTQGQHGGEVFAGSVIVGAKFYDALLDKASFEGADGRTTIFTKARLTEANLSAGLFDGADFADADLRKSVARASMFPGANFSNADLSFSRFSGSDLTGSKMEDAYAVGAVFTGAITNDVSFDRSDLTGANFESAHLSNASFVGSNVEAAIFAGAVLEGTNLASAIGLTQEQLSIACGNAETQLPEGLTVATCVDPLSN